MKEKIIALLINKSNSNLVFFNPPVEVITGTDIVFIHGLYNKRFINRNDQYFAVVETMNDKIPCLLCQLNEEILHQIYARLRKISVIKKD